MNHTDGFEDLDKNHKMRYNVRTQPLAGNQ